MDNDLKKILNRSKSKPIKSGGGKKYKPLRPSKPYSYRVYSRLYSWSTINWLVVLIGMMVLATAYFFKDQKTIALYGAGVVGALLVVYSVFNQLRYWFVFRGWQERLPFELIGWNEMIAKKNMSSDLYWNAARISVQIKSESEDLLQLVNAALIIFSKKSEKAFYALDSGQYGKPKRIKWHAHSMLIYDGSLNSEVMRMLKKMLQKEMATISKKTNQIISVTIELTSGETELAKGGTDGYDGVGID